MMKTQYDVIVVGGGAAGLSGALTLARARRSVLVIDSGLPRNAPATGMHNYLGREGIAPSEFLAIGREEAASYGAEIVTGVAVTAERLDGGGFRVVLEDGTTRTAAVLNQLEGAYNDVALNGIILISTVLDFGAGADTPGNELSPITNLPSMAATALYHGKATAPSVEQFVEEARQWAIGPYATALLKGQKLQGEERAQIRRELSRFTGLSETYLESADLRVTPSRFYKELLRDRGLTVGRLDSRYTGKDYDNAGESPDNDPSFYGIDAGYTAAINSWSRDTLGFKTTREYQSIGRIGGQWDWRIGGRDSNAYMNVAPYIGQALRENSGLKVLVAQGYYDFATPFFAAEYALSRTGIPQDRIHYTYYEAGHMMYIRDGDRHKLSEDVRAFIRAR